MTSTPTPTPTTDAPTIVERPKPTTTQVGRSVSRLESRAKVSGRAEYIHNFQVPGMLHGKILRSTVPHGRIRGIDTTAAQTLDGVYAVITGADVQKVMPDPYYGPAFHDQPVLAIDKVHYVGDPVAAVLATDPHTAEAALDLIEVDYEELPSVFDETDAAAADAPILHDVIRPAGMFVDLKHLDGRSGTNVGMEYRLRSGDVEQGFAEANHIFEDTFRTQQTMHTPLEPIVTIAELSGTAHWSFTRLPRARRSCGRKWHACSGGRRTASGCERPIWAAGSAPSCISSSRRSSPHAQC
jgi:CO/xanthine dehydrogenase Mo-binding subunit